MKSELRNFRNAATMITISILAATLQSCATSSLSMPTAKRLVETGIVAPNADLESLDRGRLTAMMDCRGCHRQYWPQEITAKRWPRLAHNMGRLASMKNDEIDDLIHYMVEASKTTEIKTAKQQ